MQWSAAHRTHFAAVSAEAPWPMMLMPRPLRNESCRVLLWMQRACEPRGSAGGVRPAREECGGAGALPALRRVFSPSRDFAVAEEVGLSGGPLISEGAMLVGGAGAGATEASSVASEDPITPTGFSRASQDNDETGVFISDDAMSRRDSDRVDEDPFAAAARPLPRLSLHGVARAAGGGVPARLPTTGELLEVRAFECELLAGSGGAAGGQPRHPTDGASLFEGASPLAAGSRDEGHADKQAVGEPAAEPSRRAWHVRAAAGGHSRRRTGQDTPRRASYTAFVLVPSVIGVGILFLLLARRRRRRSARHGGDLASGTASSAIGRGY